MNLFNFEESNLNDQGIWLALFVVLVSVIVFFQSFVLESQNGYGQSKWDSRKANEKKARERKERALREKEAREKETKEKRRIRRANQALKSQFGIKEAIEFSLDAPEWIQNTFGSSWLKLREIAENFNFTLPEINIPDVARYWVLFKESEVFAELYHILRMMITLGFIKKINISYKGMSLFVSEPLRQQLSVVQLVEQIVIFGKLLMSKIYSVMESGNIDLFFQSQVKNEYDNEYTFILSQKTRVDLGRKAEIDEETYDRRVHECIETTLSLLNTCKASERTYYASRLANLRAIQTSRILSKKEGIREKPYGVLLFGGSGVGKSAIANALTRYILQVNGFDYSPQAVTSLNMEDKYQSEFSTHHQGVIFDDICNTSLDRTEGSPTLPVIMFLNNMTMAALNANADMKGKVMIEPKVVTATTNVKDLLSNQLSNEPLSINRRFEVTITQRVRPEFCRPNSGMLDSSKITHMAHDQFPDYALYTVEEPRYRENSAGDKFRSGKTQSIVFVPREFEGKPLVDVDIKTLLRFLKSDSDAHFAHQKAFVEGQRALSDMPLCGCGMPLGMCDTCPLESQAGLPYYTEVLEYLSALEIQVISWLNNFLNTLIVSRFGSAIIAYLMRNKLKEIVLNSIGYYALCIAFTLAYDAMIHIRGSWMVLLFTIIYLSYIIARFYMVRRSVVKKFANVPLPSQLLTNMTWKTKMRLLYLLGSIGIWKVLVKLAKKWKTLPTAQAANPITLKPDAKPWQNETEFWDTHARERAYQFGDAGVSEKSRTITIPNFVQLIGNKLMVVEKESGEFCNVVPLCSNVLLLPNHMVTATTEYVTLSKIGGHMFKNMPLDNRVAVRIPNTDLAVWWCPGAGLHRDIIDYHPKDINEGKKLTVFAIYNKDGELTQFPEMTAVRSRVVTTEGGIFQGLKYSFPGNTFGGLCMATLVGNVDGMPFIAGYHLAGRDRTGAAGVITRTALREAIAQLDTRPGVLVSHSATPMETKSMNIEFGPLSAPHEKCVTQDLPNDAKIRIHGSHNGSSRSSPKSAVVTSLISPMVKEVMGIEKIHGPPNEMGARRHKELDISGKVDTATQFDSELLQKAFIDYSLKLAELPESELEKVGKISDDVNLAGLDGVLGLNAMNFTTSVGFPGKGAKTQFAQKSDRQVEGISCPRDVDPLILEEIAKMEARLRKGQSINTAFKGSLKDEPTKLTKDKVRVFAAANMPFVMLVRKYFLTLAALVQRNKIITECAVGVVVQSPEWTELYEHIGKHGWDRAIAGDYAKFDGRMSPQFMLAAFKLLIELAEKSGNYDEDDLKIMRGIATEISYPTYDYFGTLVQFMGSNPSGHPLTVVINSFVNSLYMRYVWYAIAKQKKWWRVPPFSKGVSFMTYGDDNIMTVAKGFDDFNHTAIAEELAKVSIKYTMADKDAESVPFINLSDASFLKHYAKYDPELGLYRSPVEEGSIAKMLHTHLKSKVLSMEQSSAEAIQNVALKYFEFGREVYDEKVAQLEEVARRAGITGYVGPIMSYDDRVAWYREKFALESQSGRRRRDVNGCEVNSEEERLQLKCMSEMPIKPIGKEYTYPGGACGDLLYIVANKLMIVIEVKCCKNTGPKFRKAKDQVQRYAGAMASIYPKNIVYGFTYTYDGFTEIVRYRELDRSIDWAPLRNRKFPFEL
ncbi:hypothetical protein 1 [Beihai sipunculid worm virus 4]|uniref:hypothetical protein 1 n=1 Tax=Beihai sipunculid worm virus 4 TaxID=1922676 RepID=UPI00090B7AEB|nr:hypothetical protein 1 [Beihai sipunculid worm virus 4]APG76714.1 hypothetical protein 1 [Beihai sipunculid worm virus 4]APG76842.1 hypothetical protein 1 [Beihai sipunculid worm virus 4]APG78907.1 hypothetical protein 1 [Beihai sipunculid worm virus 4]